MEQELDIKQQLGVWLSAPEKISREDAPVLKDLALLYPYFQPLHLLLAKATLQGPEQNNNLATAALYTNGQLLHSLLHAPEELHTANFEVINPASDQNSSQPEPIEVSTINEVPAETTEPTEKSGADMDEQEVFEEIGEVDVKPEDDLVMENIVASDFFAFQESFIAETVIPDQEDPNFRPSPLLEPAKPEEPIVISKYDDDQLPYTFLWWLAKTRAAHQQIFQPYASPRKANSNEAHKPASPQRPSELQHQYVEHIFHLQSPFNGEAEEEYTTEGFRTPSKGDEIIESFIKNDPQIGPLKPEQIDNENKAKKSAEDHNDLVSETLAKIYIEQMLYDKAIETYEKLSLKFPEKRRYFADLIQSIEKKI
ncbi:MAG: hypothetical protein P0Y49_20085 [Candidatus Pedobacter colombiensis]|uniref:Tetratricopeptide repeat protein n=1 Tax=Candidatus Pedobacter colombiensis TaxID=3121371 RepID=A0AAJ5W8N6_9SPHI|nr:hypothetical protein [Pedobacter sp.]WEK19079.1 MAG: hypothetical protein P0Y49_20085 [Pedobacter sp.]